MFTSQMHETGYEDLMKNEASWLTKNKGAERPFSNVAAGAKQLR
ncbi:hypothetical protein [Clostridium sp. 1xD42-85]|nr:hypothetical protein [Clostridium sp. 1xD42-85]